MKMIRKILLASAVVAAMGSFSVPASAALYVEIAPPAPRVEVVPSPRYGYTWAPGYWDWRGNRHAWVTGHWERERPGYAYVAPEWVQRDGRWTMDRHGWERREERREERARR
jgi:WXXGXW repeat (2 copies)